MGARASRDRAPFDAIAVHATAPAPPRALVRQLALGGRLVIPIATDGADMLTSCRAGEDVTPRPARLRREVIGPCRFVPLIGRRGFPSEQGSFESR